LRISLRAFSFAAGRWDGEFTEHLTMLGKRHLVGPWRSESDAPAAAEGLLVRLEYDSAKHGWFDEDWPGDFHSDCEDAVTRWALDDEWQKGLLHFFSWAPDPTVAGDLEFAQEIACPGGFSIVLVITDGFRSTDEWP
jgi:hypothetical protein